MRSSSLLLERHVFKRVEIVASPNPDPGAVNLMNIKLSCAEAAGEPDRFLVGLDLKLLPLPDSGKTPSYTGELSIEGEFRVAGELPLDRRKVLAITNGAGILFGAIREMVLGVTSRGPWSPVMLTTLSFMDMAEQMVAQSSAEQSMASEKEFARISAA